MTPLIKKETETEKEKEFDMKIVYSVFHTFNFTTRGCYFGQIQICGANGIISREAIPEKEGESA